MTYRQKFIVPKLGGPFDSARIVSWHKAPGEAFRRDDILLELETDKSVIEIPAPEDGKVVAHLVDVDGTFESDMPVAELELEGLAPESETDLPEAQPAPEPGSEPEQAPSGSRAAAAPDIPRKQEGATGAAGERVLATPAARTAARQAGLDLARVPGTGPGGRITKADVLSTTGQSPDGPAYSRAGEHPVGRSESYVSTRHGDMHIVRWMPDGALVHRTIVLIHGIFGDTETWSGLASNLRQDGAEVIAIDLPCHGKSDITKPDLADVVDCLAEVVESVCPAPHVLVGHSFGGALAARIAAFSPRLAVQSLVLIAPVGLGTEIQQAFLDGVLHASTNEALARELRKLTASRTSLSGNYLDALRAAIEAHHSPLEALCAQFSRHGTQQINIADDLKTVGCPVTIIQGRQDQIIPWTHALNAPDGARLYLPELAGHMPQWDCGKLVEAILKAAAP